MCLSNNRYPQPAVEFKDTILLGLEVRNPHGEVEHICGYFNSVVTNHPAPAAADFGWDVKQATSADDFGWDIAPPARKKGNAMLIAIPAEPGTVNESSLIAVSSFSNFMKDYKTALVPPRGGLRRGTLSIPKGVSFDAPIVVKGFDNGTYDVVIAPTAKSILSVINQVDEAKRPESNEPLYGQLDIANPGWTFVLFCFEEADAEKAGCALIKYKPMAKWSEMLYLPGLDGHNGQIERGQVALNHTLVVGSYRMKPEVGKHVSFSDAALRTNRPYYLLDQVIGKIIKPGTMAPQGDFLFLLDDVRKGKLRCKRGLPPGWKALGFGTPEGDPWIHADPPAMREFD